MQPKQSKQPARTSIQIWRGARPSGSSTASGITSVTKNQKRHMIGNSTALESQHLGTRYLLSVIVGSP